MHLLLQGAWPGQRTIALPKVERAIFQNGDDQWIKLTLVDITNLVYINPNYENENMQGSLQCIRYTIIQVI